MHGVLPMQIFLEHCQSDLGRIFPLNVVMEILMFRTTVSEASRVLAGLELALLCLDLNFQLFEQIERISKGYIGCPISHK